MKNWVVSHQPEQTNMINRRRFLEFPLLGIPLLYAKDAFGQQAFEKTSSMRVKLPVMVSTWDSGIAANAAGWPVLEKGGRALDAVEAAGRAEAVAPAVGQRVGMALAPGGVGDRGLVGHGIPPGFLTDILVIPNLAMPNIQDNR